eukprot:3039814-Rhodomonas_salina.3
MTMWEGLLSPWVNVDPAAARRVDTLKDPKPTSESRSPFLRAATCDEEPGRVTAGISPGLRRANARNNKVAPPPHSAGKG